MKKKVVLLIIIGLFLTGCSNEYNLSIEGDNINEEIVSTIPNSDIHVQTEEEIAAGIESDDQITPFINNDQYPFINNTKDKYIKSVSKDGNNTIVKLKYQYTLDNFKKSRVYNECFEKSQILREDGYIRLSFVGEFNCLYGDNLNINIKTDREVVNDTADDVDNNVYQWNINESNQNKVNIQMILKDDITTSNSGDSLTLFFIIILIIFIIVDVYIIFKKKVEE